MIQRGRFTQSEYKLGLAELCSSFTVDDPFWWFYVYTDHSSFTLDDSSKMIIQSKPCKRDFRLPYIYIYNIQFHHLLFLAKQLIYLSEDILTYILYNQAYYIGLCTVTYFGSDSVGYCYDRPCGIQIAARRRRCVTRKEHAANSLPITCSSGQRIRVSRDRAFGHRQLVGYASRASP